MFNLRRADGMADAVMGKFDLQQPNRPHYHDWAKERLKKWQCTCWSQEASAAFIECSSVKLNY